MKENEEIGDCPICKRKMFYGFSVNRHHFIPKSRGGKEMDFVHKICHSKIHSIWTNKELEREFSDPEKIIDHPLMEGFLVWIKNKDPLFYMSTRSSSRKKKA